MAEPTLVATVTQKRVKRTYWVYDHHNTEIPSNPKAGSGSYRTDYYSRVAGFVDEYRRTRNCTGQYGAMWLKTMQEKPYAAVIITESIKTGRISQVRIESLYKSEIEAAAAIMRAAGSADRRDVGDVDFHNSDSVGVKASPISPRESLSRYIESISGASTPAEKLRVLQELDEFMPTVQLLNRMYERLHADVMGIVR